MLQELRGKRKPNSKMNLWRGFQRIKNITGTELVPDQQVFFHNEIFLLLEWKLHLFGSFPGQVGVEKE
jgi:hypothetical protein